MAVAFVEIYLQNREAEVTIHIGENEREMKDNNFNNILT